MKSVQLQSYRDYPVWGRILRRHEIAGSVLSETAYTPHFSTPRHVHDQVAYFGLTLQGGYTEYLRQKNWEFGPATILYHPPGEAHSDKFSSQETRLFCVWLSRERFRVVRDHATAADNSAQFTHGSALQLAFRMYKEFCSLDELSPLVIEGLTLELLAETFRAAHREVKYFDQPWIKRARDLVQARFNDTLTVSDIAESVGVHPVHLTRVFRRRFGCTVGEYVRQLRVDFACRELSNSRKPLAEIASSAGFCDQAHFSRTLKRFTGMTPLEFRAVFRSS
jgi:AraC family transcriptional regulator